MCFRSDTEKTSSETDSPCGPGTVLDSKTNSCVLGVIQKKHQVKQFHVDQELFWILKLIHVF